MKALKSRYESVLRLKSGLILVCSLLVSLVANAERVDPFLVTVEVPDRSAASRRPALRQALHLVLVGLSGQVSLVRTLQQQSRRPFQDQWVQQFRYLESPASTGSPPGLSLEVRFNSAMIGQLADQLKLPKWPLERGVTLMWVAMDNGVERELLGAAAEHQQISKSALGVAAGRKMPLLMPLMDLDDIRQVSFSDVWGGFFDQVSLASTRYGAQYLLLGRVFRTGRGWGGQWQLQDGHQEVRWSVQGSDEMAVIAAAIEHVAEWLGQRHAVLASARTDQLLRMRLEGVRDLGDYARILRYLGGLSVIESVTPYRISPETMELSIRSNAGVDAIRQALAIEQVLAPVAAERQPGTNPIELHYILNP